MPTYVYACTECGHGFEAVQAFSDDALTTCPECSGKLRKVFNSVGIVFKGSGFYRNDSRSEGKSGASSSSSSSGESSASSESKSTDATTSDTKSSDTKASGSSASSSTSSTSSSSSSSSAGSAA